MSADAAQRNNGMTFFSQGDAKKFLVNKIVFEAKCQGTPLSTVEEKLLLFSEQEPESAVGIPAELLEDIDQEFEKRITDLLRAAYKRDRDNAQEREQYKNAMRELKDRDHYILVMADPVLSQMHAARDMVLYIAIGLLVLAAAVAFAVWRG